MREFIKMCFSIHGLLEVGWGTKASENKFVHRAQEPRVTPLPHAVEINHSDYLRRGRFRVPEIDRQRLIEK